MMVSIMVRRPFVGLREPPRGSLFGAFLGAFSGAFSGVAIGVTAVAGLACSPGAGTIGADPTGGEATATASSTSGDVGSDASGPTTTTTSTTTAGESTSTGETGELCDPADVDALYTKRIEPLLATERPKSCNQCHLAGIDLSSFVRETPCATLGCMTERGLVDLSAPSESVILDWIGRATPEGLVTEELIAEEYAGFLTWIEAAAACDSCGELDDPCGEGEGEEGPAPCGAEEPPLEFEDPGDCDELTLEAVFRNKVYAWRDRCYPCHFTSKPKPEEAPKWIEVGGCELGSLATMRNVVKAGYVDLAAPSESLLLLKPLAEDAGGVVHGGHDKFGSPEDPAYVDLRYWIERESKCQ